MQAEFCCVGPLEPVFDPREQLAFPIRPHRGEIDYPTLYPQPHPKIITALQTHPTAQVLIAHLPDTL